MTNDLSSNWTNTNSDPQGGSQGSSDDEKLFATPVEKTSGKVQITRAKSRMMPVAFGSMLTLAGVFMLVVIFVQGVNFLQASITEVPLPSLIEDVTEGTPASVPQTINIGDSTETHQAAAWPSFIKINRFTVGSSFVPDFSQTTTIPIHTVSNAYDRVHSAAGDSNLGQVRRPPATGPEMWVMVLMCLCVVPVFFLRGRKNLNAL